MTDNLRLTHAEATDVANDVLDGSDAILLGAETLRGLYLVETISTVGKICAEVEKVFNQDLYFKKTVKYVGEPMTHLESIASSAVHDIFSEAAAAAAAPCLIFFISASIAQVHQAGLRGDKIDVVVKVQHPGIQDLMMTDIRNLQAFALYI